MKPEHCYHEQTEPVVSGGQVVAHLCLDCSEQLPPGWGCPRCAWEVDDSMRRFADRFPLVQHVQTRACAEHAR